MREDYLHYAWKTHKWRHTELHTTRSETIEVLDRGTHNRDQGPDFHLASVRLDGVLWHGNIEMHVRSSDWNRHRHSTDSRYHNVILHVVWEHDTDIVCNGRTVPTLELREYISGIEMEKYASLFASSDPVACGSMLHAVPSHVIVAQTETAGVQRIMDKTDELFREVKNNFGDWEALYYRSVCRYLMTPPNAEAMDMLTAKADWRMVSQHRQELAGLEALFFGCSGLLPAETDEEYPLELKKRFTHIRRMHDLQPMKSESWYFLRMRPAHFPTLRLAQLCSYFSIHDRPLAEIMSCDGIRDLESLLVMQPSEYWQSHYQFGRPTASGIHGLGSVTRNILLINVIIPLAYAFGEAHHRSDLQEKAMRWMESARPENNRFTRMWRLHGLTARSALQSQALLHQFRNLCTPKKCLDCRIGHHILSKS